jgi:hypothetical protein
MRCLTVGCCRDYHYGEIVAQVCPRIKQPRSAVAAVSGSCCSGVNTRDPLRIDIEHIAIGKQKRDPTCQSLEYFMRLFDHR